MKKLFLGIVIGMLLMPVLQFGYGVLTEDSPEVRYSQENADKMTRQKLWKLDIKDFKGPYFKKANTLDYVTYSVCYKSKEYVLCRSDYTGLTQFGQWKEFNIQNSPRLQWLQKEP